MPGDAAAAARSRHPARPPTGWPGCSTWCRTCWPGPASRSPRRPADLGVTERQLREDLELLWVCGLPGYGPGDLIDMAFDGDRVTITYDAGIDRPLRLTPDEALALVVALRMLAEMPGRGQPGRGRAGPGQDRVRGRRRCAGAPVAVRLPGTRRPRWRRCAAPSSGGRALRITYYTAARDETTERVVDPMRVLLVGGRAYLEAWCRRAEAVRLFRVDRIDALHRAGRAGRAAAAGAARTTSATGVFRPAADLPLVTLRIGRGARWITEYYPCEGVRRGPGDEWLVSLRVTDLGLGPPARARARPGGDGGRPGRAGRGGAGRGARRAGRVRRAGAAGGRDR